MRPALGPAHLRADAPRRRLRRGDDVKSAVDPVAQAATNTQNAGSVAIAMSGRASAAGQEIPLQGEGVFDLKGKRGRFTMTTSVPGQRGVKIEEIVDGLVLYMHSDALAKGLPAGKTWLKLDLKAAGAKQGVDIAQLQSLSGGGDPTQFLSYLAKAGDVRKVGTEDVNGTSTTHYHATIAFDKLAGSAGKAADSVRQLEQMTGLKKLPTDIWIDASQRVRRQTVAIARRGRCPSSSRCRSTTSASACRSTCTRPAADETVDYSRRARAAAESARAPRSASAPRRLLGHPKLGWGRALRDSRARRRPAPRGRHRAPAGPLRARLRAWLETADGRFATWRARRALARSSAAGRAGRRQSR